jgi:hypothetical protein
VALAGKNVQARGATAVKIEPLDQVRAHVVVAVAPIVMLPDESVLPATTAPFVPVPQAPLAIVGSPPVDWDSGGITYTLFVL